MRSADMISLDGLERLLSREVVHFDEKPVRDYCQNHADKIGKSEVDWSMRRLIGRIRKDALNGASVELEENHPNARLTSVTITGIDRDSLLIKPDHFSVRCFANDTYNKACDYVLFTKFNGLKYAIFIDLKTSIYENPDGNLFSYQDDKDKDIVWQMIGADALLDGMLDKLSKKGAKRHETVMRYKRDAAGIGLAAFKRRYLILYMHVDQTGNAQPRNLQEPNILSLEKGLHVMPVNNNATVTIGDLFSVGGLEP